MNYFYERYAYNFNPRYGPKQSKLKYLIKIGVMGREDIEVGKETEHKRYKTACKDSYLAYHECLQKTIFDRFECEPYEKSVIDCEHREGLYKSNDDIIARLRLGLANCKAKRERINQNHRKKYETKKYSGKAAPKPISQTIQADEIELIEEFKDLQKYQKMANASKKTTEQKAQTKQQIED